MKFSKFQTAILDFASDASAGNLLVSAKAGSGKTTTLVEIAKRLKGKTVFLAFNKAIAEELKSRGLDGRTFHGLCYRPVTQHKKVTRVDANKIRSIIDATLTGDDARSYGAFVSKLVGLARQRGVGCLVPDTDAAFFELVDHHDLSPDSDKGTEERGVELARQVLSVSNTTPAVDFDDLLYLAVRDGVALPKFDNVLVDEAQDTNAIQRAILRKIMKKDARLFAVGDERQAIYGFRGADSDSMPLIEEEFACTRLPLSYCYRCGSSIVEHARQFDNEILPAPDSAAGEVVTPEKFSLRDFAETDLVVCRTTAPLIALAYARFARRLPVTIMGRDIGAGLVALVKKLGGGGVNRVLEKLKAWETREVEKALAAGNEAKRVNIEDKALAIRLIAESLVEGARTVPELTRIIEALFTPPPGGRVLTLATIHKAKGLEADTVIWLTSRSGNRRRGLQAWQEEQEKNLSYVAATRAKKRLVLLDESKISKD